MNTSLQAAVADKLIQLRATTLNFGPVPITLVLWGGQVFVQEVPFSDFILPPAEALGLPEALGLAMLMLNTLNPPM